MRDSLWWFRAHNFPRHFSLLVEDDDRTKGDGFSIAEQKGIHFTCCVRKSSAEKKAAVIAGRKEWSHVPEMQNRHSSNFQRGNMGKLCPRGMCAVGRRRPLSCDGEDKMLAHRVQLAQDTESRE